MAWMLLYFGVAFNTYVVVDKGVMRKPGGTRHAAAVDFSFG